MHVERGLRLEVVASDPMLSAPVAAAFDENNRLFVAETRLNPDAATSRVRVLEGLDSNGRFTQSTVLAEGLDHPSALACYGGGVFVGTGKELVFLKDADGNGTAEIKKVIFTGFGGTNALNPGKLLNSLAWGPDSRFYAAAGGIGGAISQPGSSDQPVELALNDFSFDPRTLLVRVESGQTDRGLSFDSFGGRFVCSPGHPLAQAMAEERYWLRNPFYPRANPLRDVLSPATLIYTPGPNSAAPTVRIATPTNILSAAWSKSPQGLAIYRGHAIPAYTGNAFVCDPEAHAVLRVVLSTNSLEVLGGRAARQEFLVSTDSSFRPVQVLDGPDGAIYILDAQEGERGRLYRVVPQKFARQEPVKLGGERTYDLVAALAHANGWTRDTAVRLLYERQDPTSLPLLSNMVSRARLPLAKVCALQALAALGGLGEPQVIMAMQDPEAVVRVQALRGVETLGAGAPPSDSLLVQLKRLVADPSPAVRYQLCLTLGSIRRPDKAVLLAALVMREPSNFWLQSAVLGSVTEGAGNLFVLLAAEPRFRSSPAGLAFLKNLAALIGTKGRSDEVAQVVDYLGKAKVEALQGFAMVAGLGEGLHRTRSSLALVDPRGHLQGWCSSALATAVDTSVAEPLRAAAVNLVSVSPYSYADTSDWLLLIANPQPFPGLRAAAIHALTRYDDPRVLPALAERWKGFGAPLRRVAIDGLLSRGSRWTVLLTALERGVIPARDLSSSQLNLLRTCRDPVLRERALRDLGPVPLRRPAVAEAFKSALTLKGTPARGREIFALRCAECHQPASPALRSLGPELTGARVKGKQFLFTSILEPNAQIEPGHQTVVLGTPDGEVAFGVKADESSATVSLVGPTGRAEIWPRLNVRSFETASWSFMPEGLEEGLAAQDLADLLEYLMTMAAR